MRKPRRKRSSLHPARQGSGQVPCATRPERRLLRRPSLTALRGLWLCAAIAPKLDHVRVLTGEWPPRGPKTRFCSRACPPHRGRSAWWPRTSAAVSDVARLHVGLSSMKATEREVAELSAGISAAGREEVLLERDKITKDALSAGRRRPTGRQLLSRCTPLTHRSRSSIAHRV